MELGTKVRDRFMVRVRKGILLGRVRLEGVRVVVKLAVGLQDRVLTGVKVVVGIRVVAWVGVGIWLWGRELGGMGLGWGEYGDG